MRANVEIFNTPSYELKGGWTVARNCDAELWYYGCYDTEERAKEVAMELGNGVVLEVIE